MRLYANFKMVKAGGSGHLLSCMAAPRQGKMLRSQSLGRPALCLGGRRGANPKMPRQITEIVADSILKETLS